LKTARARKFADSKNNSDLMSQPVNFSCLESYEFLEINQIEGSKRLSNLRRTSESRDSVEKDFETSAVISPSEISSKVMLKKEIEMTTDQDSIEYMNGGPNRVIDH
jgi:hypothetical protein